LINKFLSLPTDEKLLLLEALVMLFVSKIIVCFPFRYYIKLFKSTNIAEKETNSIRLQKISISLRRANKLAFWKNVCLVKSVAARFMLKRRGIPSVLSLGLQFQDRKKLTAHAWIKSGDYFVTPKGDTAFKEIFSI
jgi:uncharacterized membrane protein